MARTWLSIQVELVSGRGLDIWPRPGRVFVAARNISFVAFAHAIDVGFARWDHAHLHQFVFSDKTVIGHGDDEFDQGFLDGHALTLSRLKLGEQFVYQFDFGDSWTHLCTVARQRVDPRVVLGTFPDSPQPYFGWGEIPDQYGRRFLGDIGDEDQVFPVPPDPKFADLPPLLPHWGSPSGR